MAAHADSLAPRAVAVGWRCGGSHGRACSLRECCTAVPSSCSWTIRSRLLTRTSAARSSTASSSAPSRAPPRARHRRWRCGPCPVQAPPWRACSSRTKHTCARTRAHTRRHDATRHGTTRQGAHTRGRHEPSAPASLIRRNHRPQQRLGRGAGAVRAAAAAAAAAACAVRSSACVLRAIKCAAFVRTHARTPTAAGFRSSSSAARPSVRSSRRRCRSTPSHRSACPSFRLPLQPERRAPARRQPRRQRRRAPALS